jgi:hypothetical protein
VAQAPKSVAALSNDAPNCDFMGLAQAGVARTRHRRDPPATGAKIVAIPYFQPALSTEQPRVRNLFLMVLSAEPSVLREDDGVDAATVRCFIDEYVTGSEGDVDDDEVRALRAALRAKDVIPLLDPGEFLKAE